MAKKLYIRNLSFDVTQAQIRDLFSQVGEIVSLNLLPAVSQGRPKVLPLSRCQPNRQPRLPSNGLTAIRWRIGL